ncbi:hypothetical protein [Sneathiella glossodoripedis]|uniref:hypothetical protein n=1 Tax=Sneathiella glossodoripedis TaxID=418853 RepID=UPI00046EAAE7|nr:hypothetical protein [Sneathiella glossodoripedis]
MTAFWIGISPLAVIFLILFLLLFITIMIGGFYFFQSRKRTIYAFWSACCVSFLFLSYHFVWPWVLHFEIWLNQSDRLTVAKNCLKEKVGLNLDVPWSYIEPRVSGFGFGLLVPNEDFESIFSLSRRFSDTSVGYPDSYLGETGVQLLVHGSNYNGKILGHKSNFYEEVRKSMRRESGLFPDLVFRMRLVAIPDSQNFGWMMSDAYENSIGLQDVIVTPRGEKFGRTIFSFSKDFGEGHKEFRHDYIREADSFLSKAICAHAYDNPTLIGCSVYLLIGDKLLVLFRGQPKDLKFNQVEDMVSRYLNCVIVQE